MKAVLVSSLIIIFSATVCAARPVTDARAAMLIVYGHVNHASPTVGSFQDWEKSFRADLVRGTWEVAGKSGVKRGASVYYVRARDGRYLGVAYVD
jgi:hypothetical protein